MRFLIAAISAATLLVSANCGLGRQARRLRGRQRRLQERGRAAQSGDRRQVDGQASAQCRLRGGRRHQPHPRQDDREAARLRQEGAKAPTSRCSSMPATASRSTAPTICCRSTPTSNPKWTSSSAPRSTSTSRSNRPWAMPRSSWCSSMPAATIRSPPRSGPPRRPAASTCRPGLAEMKSGEGTLIAFATGPGQTALDGEVGTNSPFTRALIANITRPASRSSRR